MVSATGAEPHERDEREEKAASTERVEAEEDSGEMDDEDDEADDEDDGAMADDERSLDEVQSMDAGEDKDCDDDGTEADADEEDGKDCVSGGEDDGIGDVIGISLPPTLARSFSLLSAFTLLIASRATLLLLVSTADTVPVSVPDAAVEDDDKE